MKVNRIKIVDFRSHQETDISLARLTVVRGGNHSGKSTVAQAIEYALTGRTDATDAKGAGGTGLIRQGAEKATIMMKVQANKEVDLRCTLTPASGRTVTITDPSDAAWSGAGVKQWLEGQRAVLSCLLNSRYFIGLKAAEQKTLLSSIILPETYAWPESITEKALLVHLAINWNQAPFDVIEAAYKAAFDKRRDINRDLKNLQIPDPIAMPDGVADAAEAKQRLSDLRQQLSQIDKEQRTKLADRGKIQAQIAGLEQRIHALDSKFRGEHEALAMSEDRILGKKQLADAKTLAGNEKKLQDLDRDLASAKELQAGIDAVIAIYDKLNGTPECPVCRRPVTDEFLVESLRPQHEARVKANKRIQDILEEMKALGDVQGAKRSLDVHEQALAGKKRSQGIIADTQSLRTTAQTELDELRTKLPIAPSEFDLDETADLRAAISVLEGQLEKIAVAEARAKEIERAKAQHAQLAKASGILEELVKYFGPEGVKAELLREHIGGFTDGMNAGLEAWGYSCSFEIEPYGFRVTNKATSATLPLELLSGSERLRFAVAFQVALAQVSQIRMVVVDEADLFDSGGRAAFYPLLLAADLDQAIALGTDEREEIPEVDGAVFYLMQNGKAVQLEAVGA